MASGGRADQQAVDMWFHVCWWGGMVSWRSAGQRLLGLLVTQYFTQEIKELFVLLYHLFLSSNRVVCLGTCVWTFGVE